MAMAVAVARGWSLGFCVIAGIEVIYTAPWQ